MNLPEPIPTTEMRWNCGTIEYRSRLMRPIPVNANGAYIYEISVQWSPWTRIDAVKGDDSDRRFE